ncbi:hypothetical protein DFH29DRAFT_995226 [Suillus ampliporus]|nr:hypothetical protein DFH29DRAFT_995226 [Suillus ampliporus]
MATSASFHGVVGIQNGGRFQIDKKNFWRYDGFIATPDGVDLHINVFMFGANTASVEDGKLAHSLHLFANDELQPLPDGARAFPTVIIAGKVSRGTFSLKQENGFDMDISQYVAGPQQNTRVRCYYPQGHPRFTKTPLPTASKHVVVQGTVHNIIGDQCIVVVKDITLGPSDMVVTTDDSSENAPPTSLKQFDWGGAHKDKEKDKGKEKEKAKGKEQVKEVGKRAHDDDDSQDSGDGPLTSTTVPAKVARVSK